MSAQKKLQQMLAGQKLGSEVGKAERDALKPSESPEPEAVQTPPAEPIATHSGIIASPVVHASAPISAPIATDVVQAIADAEAIKAARDAEEERAEPNPIRRLLRHMGVPVSRS